MDGFVQFKNFNCKSALRSSSTPDLLIYEEQKHLTVSSIVEVHDTRLQFFLKRTAELNISSTNRRPLSTPLGGLIKNIFLDKKTPRRATV